MFVVFLLFPFFRVCVIKITAGGPLWRPAVIVDYEKNTNLFLHGSLLEGLDEQFPEGLGCGDVGTLDGGVRAAQRGTETNDVHVRVLAQDDGALQTGVVHLDDAVLLKQFLVQVEQHVQGLAVGVGIAADVVTAGLNLEVGEVEAGHQHR